MGKAKATKAAPIDVTAELTRIGTALEEMKDLDLDEWGGRRRRHAANRLAAVTEEPARQDAPATV